MSMFGMIVDAASVDCAYVDGAYVDIVLLAIEALEE